MSVNEITGDSQKTKPASDEYRDNFDRIFGMKQYSVPIDFTVKANSDEEAKLRIDEFLMQAVSEFRLTYNIIDYSAPYGYPTEEVSSS